MCCVNTISTNIADILHISPTNDKEEESEDECNSKLFP